MEIDIIELKRVINILLDYVEKQGGKKIKTDNDLYWFVSSDSLFDPYSENPDLTLGQLTEDWDSLRNILSRKDDPIGYALVWASTLLRAIGDSVP